VPPDHALGPVPPLDRRSHVPLVAQLARALSDEIRRGRRRPGDPLPGTRPLARALAVHRNTVVAAFAELAAEGWIEARRGEGSFVSAALPAELAPRPRGRAPARPAPAVVLPAPRDAPPGCLRLDVALPDPRLFDLGRWARAYRRAATGRHGRAAHDYGDGRGHPRLRAALAAHLRQTRGLAIGADEVLVTQGSQQAIYVAAAALLARGDRAAVEGLGYPPAWRALEAAGARLAPIPVDRDGARIDALARRPPRALYLTPHHQYPTAVTLAASRRLELAALAGRHGAWILEDDYDGELHYDARPVAPLAADDPAGRVVHIGSLSKLLAPGLRLGYAVASADVIEALAARRRVIDRAGDVLAELAAAELLEDGELERHVRRVRRIYRGRRDAFVGALRGAIGERAAFDVPAGGMALWLRLGRGLDPATFAARCAAAGVAVGPAADYAFAGRPPAGARVCWAAHDERTLIAAAGRIGRVLAAR
jgi:GntR family transcriptional regulator/MocR family aminotransferase